MIPWGTLCAHCSTIFRGEIPLTLLKPFDMSVDPSQVVEPIPIAQTLSDVKEAAEKGCSLCQHRWSNLSVEDRAKLDDGTEIRYVFWKQWDALGVAFEYYGTTAACTEPTVTQSILCIPETEFDHYLKPDLPAPTEYSGALSTMQLARYWIDDCSRNHKECQELFAPYTLLTRLIDIGNNALCEPSLCLSESLHPSTKYITLSHCWGKLQFDTLTRENYEEMKMAIPSQCLTQTFKDAIQIARHLNLRYLWIDSLCIVQNDEDDWRREAKMMGSVYQNSTVNIAAALGPDGRSGCFITRDAAKLGPSRIKAEWNDESLRGTYFLHDSGLWRRGVSEHVLQSRGWVTQEMILSPRILHFGRNQVFWECRERHACEMFPKRIPHLSEDKLSIRLAPLPPSIVGPRDLYELWDEIVARYTICELTYYTKDKLIAISGVASALNIQGGYLAGLWKSDLIRQLLWTTHRGFHQKPTRYQAPTWSWACLNGAISPRNSARNLFELHARINHLEDSDQRETTLVRIVSAMTDLCDPANEYGAVSWGQIDLYGISIPTDIISTGLNRGEIVGHSCELNFDLRYREDIPKMHALPIIMISGRAPRIFGIMLSIVNATQQIFVRRGYFEALKKDGPKSFERLKEYCCSAVDKLVFRAQDTPSDSTSPGSDLPCITLI